MGYRPRIQRAAGFYDLPLPVKQTTETFTKRVGTSEVPLQPGVFVKSLVQGPLTLSFAGLIVVGNPQDADRYGSLGMVNNIIEEKDLLVDWLQQNNNSPFTLYRFVDGATLGGTEFGLTGQTRFYKDCVCSDLQFAHTNQTTRVLPYSFSILVPDGNEYYVET